MISGNLQIHGPKMKKVGEILVVSNGHIKPSRSARDLGEPAESVRCVRLSGGIYSPVQHRQMRFYPGIIDTQELSGAGHHVTIKVLAFGSPFVHELKYKIGRVGMLKDRAGDHEQGFSQMRRAALGNTAGLGGECTGPEGRRVPCPRKPPECSCE